MRHRLRRNLFLHLHAQHGLANLEGLPLGHVDLGDFAGVGAGNFHHGLVGFEFDNAVIGGNHVALAHQHADHVATGDVFAQFGKLEVHVHGSLISRG